MKGMENIMLGYPGYPGDPEMPRLKQQRTKILTLHPPLSVTDVIVALGGMPRGYNTDSPSMPMLSPWTLREVITNAVGEIELWETRAVPEGKE